MKFNHMTENKSRDIPEKLFFLYHVVHPENVIKLIT